jgi:hypothetical protein
MSAVDIVSVQIVDRKRGNTPNVNNFPAETTSQNLEGIRNHIHLINPPAWTLHIRNSYIFYKLICQQLTLSKCKWKGKEERLANIHGLPFVPFGNMSSLSVLLLVSTIQGAKRSVQPSSSSLHTSAHFTFSVTHVSHDLFQFCKRREICFNFPPKVHKSSVLVNTVWLFDSWHQSVHSSVTFCWTKLQRENHKTLTQNP